MNWIAVSHWCYPGNKALAEHSISGGPRKPDLEGCKKKRSLEDPIFPVATLSIVSMLACWLRGEPLLVNPNTTPSKNCWRHSRCLISFLKEGYSTKCFFLPVVCIKRVWYDLLMRSRRAHHCADRVHCARTACIRRRYRMPTSFRCRACLVVCPLACSRKSIDSFFVFYSLVPSFDCSLPACLLACLLPFARPQAPPLSHSVFLTANSNYCCYCHSRVSMIC